MRRRGLLRALAEGPPPAAPPKPPPAPPSPPRAEPAPAPAPVEAPPVDPKLTAKLEACNLACAAVVNGVADLPAVAAGPDVFDVALIRMRVRRPEGDAECCVRQHIPREIRAVFAPGAGVLALAHEHDRHVAIVDWAATGAWIGTQLSYPSAPGQYDWPPAGDWPASGEIEVHDLNGQRSELERRRNEWRFASADLMALTPLRSRVDQRDEWRVTLELRDGTTIAIKDRVPQLAVARLRAGDEDLAGTPIDVLVSAEGDVVVDWEATLRHPELRSSGR